MRANTIITDLVRGIAIMGERARLSWNWSSIKSTEQRKKHEQSHSLVRIYL